MPSTSCKDHVKEYCANCTFAGVHYVADDTRHWSERWLWVGLIALCWYLSVTLIIAAWDAFLTSPISFGVETTYIDWETTMPAVAVCEEDNKKRIYNVSDTIWTPDHTPDLEDVLKELAYFRGTLFYTLDRCYKYKVDPLCPLSNFSYYADLVRSKCPDTLANCAYNGRTFDCCEYFQHIRTDLGSCYILNSIQTENPKPFPMVNNKTTRRSVISFEVFVPSKIYTIGEDEVPTITTTTSYTLQLKIGLRYRRLITVRNIENDPLVVQTTPEQRACRFLSENEDGLYPRYSYSTCTILCRKRAQLKLCGCNDHLMPGTAESERCNITGLACLAAHLYHLTTLKPRWAPRPGLACDCLPSCSETEVTAIKNEELPVPSLRKKKSEVEIVLARLPTERFKRNVVRSRLDLVVSIGGTTGLFVGASLLSFVELIFFFTIRYINNVIMEREKQSKPVQSLAEVAGFNGRTDEESVIRRPANAFESTGVLEAKAAYDRYLSAASRKFSLEFPYNE